MKSEVAASPPHALSGVWQDGTGLHVTAAASPPLHTSKFETKNKIRSGGCVGGFPTLTRNFKIIIDANQIETDIKFKILES